MVKDTDTTVEDQADTEEVQFFDIYRTITAGEKIALLRQLDVPEFALEQAPSTPNTIAVVWKHQKNIGKKIGVAALLGESEDELLARLGLTADQVVAQFAIKYGKQVDDDSKSADDGA